MSITAKAQPRMGSAAGAFRTVADVVAGAIPAAFGAKLRSQALGSALMADLQALALVQAAIANASDPWVTTTVFPFNRVDVADVADVLDRNVGDVGPGVGNPLRQALLDELPDPLPGRTPAVTPNCSAWAVSIS